MCNCSLESHPHSGLPPKQEREGIVSLCSGEIPPAVLPPALESQHRKDMELLE